MGVKREICVFSDRDWSKKSAKFIKDLINNNCKCNPINLMLTGGRSALEVYKNIDKSYFENTKYNIFLTDERNVKLVSKKSNYKNVFKNLFDYNLPQNVTFNPPLIKEIGLKKNLINYRKAIPKKVDLLLLTLGDDGHIASLFPNKKYLNEIKEKAIITVEPKNFVRRISITKGVIDSARFVVVLVPGKNKGLILSEMEGNKKIPANFIKNAFWLLNKEAFLVYSQQNF